MRCRNQTSQDLKTLQEKKPALGRDNDDGFVKHEEEKTLPVESNNESPLKMVNGSIIENIKNLRGEEGCNPPPEVNVLFFHFYRSQSDASLRISVIALWVYPH